MTGRGFRAAAAERADVAPAHLAEHRGIHHCRRPCLRRRMSGKGRDGETGQRHELKTSSSDRRSSHAANSSHRRDEFSARRLIPDPCLLIPPC